MFSGRGLPLGFFIRQRAPTRYVRDEWWSWNPNDHRSLPHVRVLPWIHNVCSQKYTPKRVQKKVPSFDFSSFRWSFSVLLFLTLQFPLQILQEKGPFRRDEGSRNLNLLVHSPTLLSDLILSHTPDHVPSLEGVVRVTNVGPKRDFYQSIQKSRFSIKNIVKGNHRIEDVYELNRTLD